jgi:hypothetical protein
VKRAITFLSKATRCAGRASAILLALALSLLLTPPHTGHCEDAMGMSDDIKEIELSHIQYNRQSADYYGYIKGSIPVLISAPHGARHYRARESRWKAEDAYTSSWAVKLGQLTGAHVLYVKNKAAEDPNNDIRSRYKDFLGKVVKENGIRFIIDFHGAGRREPFKIDVGTVDDRSEKSSCPTFKPIIERAFRDYDTDIFNKRFDAKGACTITSYARNTLGIEAAQFEINARCRIIQSRSNPSIKADEDDVRDLMERLRGMIIAINERIAGGASEDPQAVSLLHGIH